MVRDLKQTHPQCYHFLMVAEGNRTRRLKNWKSGIRLKGIEELIAHLPEVSAVYQRNRKLRRIAFLIDRAQGDFVTALEATLSGFHLVTFDAMRDVMEIEFLLRDFYYEPSHIAEWLDGGDECRYSKFRPAILRHRHAARFERQPQDLSEAKDYKGHSMFLHVSPYRNPFGEFGLNQSDQGFAADSGFWEMYEHGRRVVHAIHNLRRKVARHLKSPWGPERGLKNFKRGWHATQTMQTVFRALIDVMMKDECTGDA